MSINSIPLAQFILLTIIGAFFGNLLSIFVDKRFSEEDGTQDKPKVSKAILSSVKTTLYGVPWLVLWLSFLIAVPLYWDSIR